MSNKFNLVWDYFGDVKFSIHEFLILAGNISNGRISDAF